VKTRKLREELAKLAARPAELAKVLPSACTLSHVAPVLAIRSGGAALTPEKRDELLELVIAGKHVEIEIDMLAFEQEAGKRNRNSVRFRDGMLMAFGRTGAGNPFLKNHNRWEMEAKGGSITSSQTSKLAEGRYAIHQTAKLVAPWATEMALRGLLDAVSIHWAPTGPVLCSACDAPIFTQCWHFPGDRLSEQDAGKQGKRLVRDPKGELVVEWIYTEAELRETSAIPIGGVPTAQVKDVRAALAEHVPALAAELAAGGNFDLDLLQEETHAMDPKLLALLGLSENATADEVLAAVEKRNKDALADKAANAILQSELSAFKKELEVLGLDKRKRDEDAFVTDALSTGRIAKGDEEHWRALFAADQKRATELMTKREPGSATPVGQSRQSGTDPDRAILITGGARVQPTLAQRRDHAIAQLKANPQAAAWACVMGLDPKGRFEVPTHLGATTISNDAELEPARIGFQAAFLETVAGEPDPSMMLATETTSNKREENYGWVGELPGMQEWKTDRMLKVLEAYSLAIRNKKWEASLRLKNDDIADDNLGLLPPLISDMAANARLHPGILVARLLLNGFAGTAYPDLGDGLAFDGEFFFSADHATGSNVLAVAFSAANLDTASQLLRKQKRFDADAKEGSLYAKGTHLFVGVADELLAEKVLTQEMLAGGESNTNRGKYTLVVTPEFSDGEWALADLRGAVRPFIFQTREAISTSTVGGRGNSDTVGFMYDEVWMGAKARYNAGYFDFRRIVGSKP
jgi:phage major head subunit gpT-like protein